MVLEEINLSFGEAAGKIAEAAETLNTLRRERAGLVANLEQLNSTGSPSGDIEKPLDDLNSRILKATAELMKAEEATITQHESADRSAVKTFQNISKSAELQIAYLKASE